MNKDKTPEEQGILGKLLQRLDALTLSLTEKKKELDMYSQKAQEAADTLDVASTKLISSFTDVANLEKALQATLAQSIERGADRIAQHANREIGQQLQDVIDRLNATTQGIQRISHESVSSIRYRRWLWIGVSVVLGSISAGISTSVCVWLSDPSRTALNQKLIKYGSAFVQYIDTLPKSQQEAVYKKIKGYLDN